MTSEQVRRHLDTVPFTPFRVHMANGRHADVPHPDFLHVFPGGRFSSIVHADETMEVMDVFLITSIQALPGRVQPAHTKRPRRK
jgi:hypothetical protein